MKKERKKIVCLGGGIGTVNLLKGLKKIQSDVFAVVSTADEGGSGGRLRRVFDIVPPGDFVSCMAALADDKRISELLTYRFPGNRYGKDNDLGGHKLGNLILTALFNRNGDFREALRQMKSVFNIEGNVFPATLVKTRISAKTIENKMIYGEENIDLGKYKGERVLKRIFLSPKNASSPAEVTKAIGTSDLVVAGPGDLYTTILPVLMAKDIVKALRESKNRKFFVVNVANKPFETKGYSVSDYLNAIERHLGFNPFGTVIVNENFSVKIPRKYKYSYVSPGKNKLSVKILKADLVDEDFPLYHDCGKLAKIIEMGI
ncbi:MAG: YvcK family protein [Patescibacteria group bacterium]|nr:YvcK family protein [Patescibacteria group bacterium]